MTEQRFNELKIWLNLALEDSFQDVEYRELYYYCEQLQKELATYKDVVHHIDDHLIINFEAPPKELSGSAYIKALIKAAHFEADVIYYFEKQKLLDTNAWFYGKETYHECQIGDSNEVPF